MRRRITRKGRRKRNQIIVISFLCLLLFLCVGYAAFGTQLSIRAKGNIKEKPHCMLGGIKVNTVTEGDGLYEDIYEEGKCIYKGANPNNYIKFNNEIWRILSIDLNGSLKIVRNELLTSVVFDDGTGYSNAWETSNIKIYLNPEYLKTITINQDKIIPYTWSIGAVIWDNNDLASQIADENEGHSQSVSVALITASEYLRANTNIEQCGSNILNNDNKNICKITNWLFKEKSYWTLSPRDSVSYGIYVVGFDGPLYGGSVLGSQYVLPAINLSHDITLTGKGTLSEPFEIV